jgi:hypothetical protein
MIRAFAALALLGCFAGIGLIEIVRFWTPAMPGDVRGFFVAMLVIADICFVMWAVSSR